MKAGLVTMISSDDGNKTALFHTAGLWMTAHGWRSQEDPKTSKAVSWRNKWTFKELTQATQDAECRYNAVYRYDGNTTPDRQAGYFKVEGEGRAPAFIANGDESVFCEPHPSARKVSGKLISEYAPKGAQAAIIAELHENESDSMSDYHGHKILRYVLIGWRMTAKENFKTLRKVAGSFKETRHLGPGIDTYTILCVHNKDYPEHGTYKGQNTTPPQHAEQFCAGKYENMAQVDAALAEIRAIEAAKNYVGNCEYLAHCESIEHRENYSMGGGNYLKAGYRDSNGWCVRSLPMDYFSGSTDPRYEVACECRKPPIVQFAASSPSIVKVQMIEQTPAKIESDRANAVALAAELANDVQRKAERRNADRAKAGALALAAYPDADSDSPQDALADLIANLMHWARANQVDFNDAYDTASAHYAEEVRETAQASASNLDKLTHALRFARAILEEEGKWDTIEIDGCDDVQAEVDDAIFSRHPGPKVVMLQEIIKLYRDTWKIEAADAEAQQSLRLALAAIAPYAATSPSSGSPGRSLPPRRWHRERNRLDAVQRAWDAAKLVWVVADGWLCPDRFAKYRSYPDAGPRTPTPGIDNPQPGLQCPDLSRLVRATDAPQAPRVKRRSADKPRCRVVPRLDPARR